MAGAAYFLDAVGTPFGRYGGALGGVRPDELGGAHTLSVHRLVAAGGGWGLAAICIGVGQGLTGVAEA
jgi:hypothetical protein